MNTITDPGADLERAVYRMLGRADAANIASRRALSDGRVDDVSPLIRASIRRNRAAQRLIAAMNRARAS